MNAPSSPSNRQLFALLSGGVAVLTLLKLSLAAQLDLYSDEVFYWLESTQPALAYSDLPFVTAQLAGLFSSGGGNALAVRLPFLVLGALLPVVLYWVARPITSHRLALESACLTLCLPLGGFLGLLAVPDVPLVLLGLGALGCFYRAQASNNMAWWLATGVLVALGLCTHYRFLLYPAAALLFLLTSEQGRRQWRRPGLWIAFAIAALGLIPIAWFNLSFELSSASFYFVERHPWRFDSEGLLHLPRQALIVTPPLYALLLYCLVWLGKNRQQNPDLDGDSAVLLLSLAALHLIVYALLAPWADVQSTSIHWPLSGYFPLLIALPLVLRELSQWLSQQLGPALSRGILTAIPVIGFVSSLLAIGGIGSQAYQQSLQTALGPDLLSTKMAGWKEFAEHTGDLLSAYDTAPLLVTDNYYTAAQLEFASLTGKALTLDRDKSIRDGRLTQLLLWERQAESLASRGKEAFLFITEDSTLTLDEKDEVLARACELGAGLRFQQQLELFSGDKRFSYYSGTLGGGDGRCPYDPRGWIDAPAPQQLVSGTVEVQGWALSRDFGVAGLRLLIDGKPVARQDGLPTGYGIERPDVVEVMSAESDPNAPGLGFSLAWDTRPHTNGEHSLGLEVISASGRLLRLRTLPVVISN